MGKKRLLVDIGSIFTKIVAIDLEQEIVLSSVKSPSTIKNGVTIGVLEALKIVDTQTGPLDRDLAAVAVETSFERHTGKAEVVYGPHGEMVIQTGKALGMVDNVIGTGGPIICSLNLRKALAGVLAEDGKNHFLKPKTADFSIDKDYIMYAIRLLVRSEPQKALRIMKKSLLPV